MTATKTFAYCVVDLPDSSAPARQELPGRQGQQGWELVTVVRNTYLVRFCFKRETVAAARA